MFDVVVIGLGGVGSFSLRSLSRRGLKILGIERFRRCHDRGSSHGGSRIYRKAYFEHPNYVPLIQYSEQVFREMDKALLENCGTLVMEEPDGPVVKSCQESAERHGIPTEFLSNAELRHRYPQFRLASNDTVGLLEPGGGFVRPEKAMDAALAEAEQNGVEIIEEVVVDGLVPVDDGVEIHITRNKSHDVIPSKAAIIASGPWASSLIPSWAPYLKVTRQLQAWINVGDNDTFSSSNMPTWYMSTPYSNLPLYGIPCDPASENPRWIKFGIHVRDIPMNPSYSSPHLVSFERRELMDAAHVCLTCEPTFELAKPCLYTMSPDAHFLVGTPREFHKKVVAAAGLSGHGFKMVPALGEMLTDMVLGEDVAKWKAEFLSPSRFGIQS